MDFLNIHNLTEAEQSRRSTLGSYLLLFKIISKDDSTGLLDFKGKINSVHEKLKQELGVPNNWKMMNMLDLVINKPNKQTKKNKLKIDKSMQKLLVYAKSDPFFNTEEDQTLIKHLIEFYKNSSKDE
jgi:hypothetical protein